jgi:hypothetical protein
MSSDFRSAENFAGSIDDKNNLYVFTKLRSIDSMKRVRNWTQFIMLLPSDTDLEYLSQIDWEIPENRLEIKPEYFSDMKLSNIIAVVYNEQGIDTGKLTRNAGTIITSGSAGLENKKNSRNVFIQALIKGRSHYNKKVNAGYSESNTKTEDDLFYGMAASNFDDNVSRVTYPCYSQPKLDGNRCLITLRDNKVIKYSRRKKLWPGIDDLDSCLMPLLLAIPNVTLDGELYVHGTKLQDITGVARNETKKFDLNYYIFDAFIPSENGESASSDTFTKRIYFLKKLNSVNKSPRIKFVETLKIKNFADMERVYKYYLRNKYEGQMIRIANSVYQTSKFREVRSRDLLKRKLLFTDEFIFTGVEQSTTGRASGTFIGVFETKNKEIFRATAKNYTMEESRELYEMINNNLQKYIGMDATIEFQELSNTGVPLRAKFVAFRKDGE